MLLSPGQKSAISARVSNNWTSFDAPHSVRDLEATRMGMVLWEICCGPNSSLSKKMSRQGFRATRLTHERNFDLSSRKKVDQAISLIPHSQPTRVWASPRCTAVSFQDMNQRTPEQRHEFFFLCCGRFRSEARKFPPFLFLLQFCFLRLLEPNQNPNNIFSFNFYFGLLGDPVQFSLLLPLRLTRWETQCSSSFFFFLLLLRFTRWETQCSSSFFFLFFN